MKRIQVGDLVKHISSRKQLACGIVTAVRFYHKDEEYSYDVLWSCGRHSAHVEMYLALLEAS
mgnify:FL=1